MVVAWTGVVTLAVKKELVLLPFIIADGTSLGRVIPRRRRIRNDDGLALTDSRSASTASR